MNENTFRTLAIFAIVGVLASGLVVLSAGTASAHEKDNKVTDLGNITSSQQGVTVTDGNITIDEGTTYTTDTLHFSDVNNVHVNIASTSVNSGIDAALVNSTGDTVGTWSLNSGLTGEMSVFLGSDYSDGNYTIEVTVPDDSDATSDSITLSYITREGFNTRPTLVFPDAQTKYQIEQNESLEIDLSNSFDINGDNYTITVFKPDRTNETLENGTFTINKSNIGEYTYSFEIEDEHGVGLPKFENEITVTVLEDGALSTGGTGSTGGSGPLGLGYIAGIPIAILLAIIAVPVALLFVIAAAE